MQGSLFIVWRESVEALLVIGVLYNWLKREGLLSYVKYLWYGTALGLLCSALLATIFWFASNWYGGSGGEWLFTAMMAISAIFILQMVVWMHHNGKNMKKKIEAGAEEKFSKSQGLGILLITLLAVAREGSETVVFLYGIGAQQTGVSLIYFIMGGLIGFILAIISFILLQKFANAISWKYFFLISETILLMIGGALFVSAFDKASGQLATYDISDTLYNFMANPIWNTSFLLKDSSTLTSLTGYHATPSAMQVITLAFYWILAIILCNKASKQKSFSK